MDYSHLAVLKNIFIFHPYPCFFCFLNNQCECEICLPIWVLVNCVDNMLWSLCKPLLACWSHVLLRVFVTWSNETSTCQCFECRLSQKGGGVFECSARKLGGDKFDVVQIPYRMCATGLLTQTNMLANIELWYPLASFTFLQRFLYWRWSSFPNKNLAVPQILKWISQISLVPFYTNWCSQTFANESSWM